MTGASQSASTILLVDDGGPALDELAERLSAAGFHTVALTGCQRLIEAFVENAPDSCVVAATDPQVFAHLAALRADVGFRHVPIIVIGIEQAPIHALPMVELLPSSASAERVHARVRANLEIKLLIDQGQRRTERLTSLLDIGRAVNSSLDKGAILYTITRNLSEAMALGRCSFIVPDLVQGVGKVIACKDDPNIHSLEINLNNYPEIMQVLRSGNRVIIDDVETDPIMAGVRKFADVFRGQSIMTLPLKNHDQIIGVLQIRKKGHPGFAEREIEYCELLANAAANALKNAQLYEDIEKHNVELRRQKRELEQLSAELRQKNQELIDLQQLKQDFTAMIVHDLRSPLMIVQGVLDLLHLKQLANPSEKELIEDGLGVTKKMLALIRNLLDVAKIEAGEFLLQPEELEVASLMREAVDPFKVLAQSRQLGLTLETDPKLRSIRADRGSIHQIMDNLLSNAFKFTLNGGHVTAKAHCHPTDPMGIVLTVEDTGIGIPLAEQTTIFKRFRQGKAGTHQGTGLGLNIIDMLAAAHGGRVELDSEPGRGSRFVVTLPSLAKGRPAVMR